MFLSNLHRHFLLLILIVPIFQACSGIPANSNSNTPIASEIKSEFPFSTKEPETYQGDFVVTIGTTEEHFFRARKGDSSRIDLFEGSDISSTQIVTDKIYNIDPARKIYTEESIASGALNSVPVFDATNGFFAGKEYTAFEETGHDGSITRYRVKNTDTSKGEILVSVDKASGLMVRQEFIASMVEGSEPAPNLIFEIRNLKLDVDEDIFRLPAGLRKVGKSEFRTPTPKADK
ncbi:MAG: hypothetical protein KA956_04620 [Pyrinomonadaceae bacterium]|nr:hypothetical protein [Acidobacteriota bacterium]MBP7375737.1 hypothetical protein [Pyrinomonadaceae bacterium]